MSAADRWVLANALARGRTWAEARDTVFLAVATALGVTR